MVSGVLQSVKSQPGWLIVVTHKEVKMPFHAELLRFRAEACEKSRLRCLSKSCSLRPESERALIESEDQPTACNEEVPPDDKEVELYDIMEPETDAALQEDQEDEPMPDSQNGQDEKRDWIVDLFPFARPAQFYRSLITDILRMEGVTQLAILSSSAHPASWLAARQCQAAPRPCLAAFPKLALPFFRS